MEDWIDKEVHAVIECGFDETIEKSCPIIAIGDKKFTQEEFGDEAITFEGWTFDFKFSSFDMSPEADP